MPKVYILSGHGQEVTSARGFGHEASCPDHGPGVLHLYPRFQRCAAQTGHKRGYPAIERSHVPLLPSYAEGTSYAIERIGRPFILGQGSLRYQAGILQYAARVLWQAPKGSYIFPCLVPPARGSEQYGRTTVAVGCRKKTNLIGREAHNLLCVRNCTARITG